MRQLELRTFTLRRRWWRAGCGGWSRIRSAGNFASVAAAVLFFDRVKLESKAADVAVFEGRRIIATVADLIEMERVRVKEEG